MQPGPSRPAASEEAPPASLVPLAPGHRLGCMVSSGFKVLGSMVEAGRSPDQTGIHKPILKYNLWA